MIISTTTTNVVIIFLLCASMLRSLEVRQSLFDICEFRPPQSASAQCLDEPPCKFCVKVLSQNSVYRISDILIHSGLKWNLDGQHILDKKSEYNNSFLYNVLEKNGLARSDPVENVREMRNVILRRAPEVLTVQDKVYLEDDNTALVYLRAGDRIDRVPIALFSKRVTETRAKRIVLSFVLHFGQWTEEDIAEQLRKHEEVVSDKDIFSYTDMDNAKNYEYIWHVVQHFRKAVPGIEIVIRSNEKPDEDLALYVLKSNFISCSSVGFEKLITNLRNNSDGIMDRQVEASLAARGISKTWIQYGGYKSAGTVQYVILVSLGWLMYGYDGVVFGYAQDTWRDTSMGNTDRYLNMVDKLTITSTHSTQAIVDAYKSTHKITVFTSVRGRESPSGDTIENTIENANSIAPVVDESVIKEVAYMQNYDDLVQGGIGPQVDQYISEVFDISSIVDKRSIDDLKRWLEIFHTTRRCCGANMEESWRSILHSSKQEHDQGQGQEGGTFLDLTLPTKSAHSCQRYNFSAIEEELQQLEAHLFLKRMTRIGSCQCSISKTIRNKLTSDSGEYAECEGILDRALLKRYAPVAKTANHRSKSHSKNSRAKQISDARKEALAKQLAVTRTNQPLMKNTKTSSISQERMEALGRKQAILRARQKPSVERIEAWAKDHPTADLAISKPTSKEMLPTSAAVVTLSEVPLSSERTRTIEMQQERKEAFAQQLAAAASSGTVTLPQYKPNTVHGPPPPTAQAQRSEIRTAAALQHDPNTIPSYHHKSPTRSQRSDGSSAESVPLHGQSSTAPQTKGGTSAAVPVSAALNTAARSPTQVQHPSGASAAAAAAMKTVRGPIRIQPSDGNAAQNTANTDRSSIRIQSSDENKAAAAASKMDRGQIPEVIKNKLDNIRNHNIP